MTATGSLSYRRHQADIWRGQAPEKYTRLLPFITGSDILEIGAAEGVLSLLLASRDPLARVTALEMHRDRHETALALQGAWRSFGREVDGCTMVQGDIRERLDLLHGVETFVAVRTIYHLGDAIEPVFRAVAEHASSVVLCGNPGRAAWAKGGGPRNPKMEAVGPFNVYAGVEGMVGLLEKVGYTIGHVVKEGDPIVTGRR